MTPPFEADFQHAPVQPSHTHGGTDAPECTTCAPVQPTPEPDAGGEALDPVTAAVVAVLLDRTYDQHAADESIWDETVWHLNKVVTATLADRLAEAVKAERDRITAAIEARMGRDADYDDGLEDAATLARTAPLQDAEEVGE